MVGTRNVPLAAIICDALVVDEGAVLDRPYAGGDRLLDAVRGVGVRSDRHVVPARLRYRGLEFLRAEGDVARIVADRLVGASDQQLDPVGAVLDLLADGLADLFRAVRDQSVSNHILLGREIVDVAAAAGDRDVVPGACQAGRDEDAACRPSCGCPGSRSGRPRRPSRGPSSSPPGAGAGARRAPSAPCTRTKPAGARSGSRRRTSADVRGS